MKTKWNVPLASNIHTGQEKKCSGFVKRRKYFLTSGFLEVVKVKIKNS